MDCPYCGCHTCCNPNTGGACNDCGRLVNTQVIDTQWLRDMAEIELLMRRRADAAIAQGPQQQVQEGAPF